MLLVGLPARAAELRWSAPAQCPDRRDVAREIERLVGQPLQAFESADFTVEIASVEPGFELRLLREERVSAERRSRVLRGATCSEVTDAAAVAIAMALQGDEAGATSEWRTAGPEAPAPRPRSVDPAPLGRSAASPVRDRGTATAVEPSPFHVMAGAAGVVDFGALPQAAPGAELDLAAGYRRLRLTASGTLFGAVEATASQGGGGEFRLWTAGLMGCFDQPLRGYTFAACGGFELGNMRGRGVDVSTARERSATWRAGRVDAGVSLPAVGPLAVAIRASALVPFDRPEFVLDGAEVVHRAAAVCGRLLVGVEIRP